MSTTKRYDSLNRLTSIHNVIPSLSRDLKYLYGYNQANQRTNLVVEGDAAWRYQYDSLGQVTAGSKKWSDGTDVAGQQYGYAFDDIGNRLSATVNGHQAAYTANSLNQYTSRTVPGVVNVLGTAATNATITVNYQRALRKDEYFSREFGAENYTSAVYTQVTVIGVLKNAGAGAKDIETEEIGHEFIPKTPERFSYDLDGNLTSDGRWTNTWDAENRLIGMETIPAAVSAGAPKQKLAFGYDYIGRRISKIVSNWTGSAWAEVSNLKFLYDGWNLVAELDKSNALVRSYVWGLDLSGSEQGAGGVGGLLFTTQGTNSTTYCASYDGNGNVTALVDAGNGTNVSEYEYGPFGEAIGMTGPAAAANPFRFSTKYTDGESGLINYGLRLYNPSSGRWQSRDSLEELGSFCLYAYGNNDLILGVDSDGRLYREFIRGVYQRGPYEAQLARAYADLVEWSAAGVDREGNHPIIAGVAGAYANVYRGVASMLTLSDYVGAYRSEVNKVASIDLRALESGRSGVGAFSEGLGYAGTGLIGIADLWEAASGVDTALGSDLEAWERMTLGASGTSKLLGTAASLAAAYQLHLRTGVLYARPCPPTQPPLRALDDLRSLRGATPDEIRSLIPKDWQELPLRKGRGVRFLNPQRPGETIMIEEGWPNHTDPLHQGPYLRISRNGIVTRIPLEGNPTLRGQ